MSEQNETPILSRLRPADGSVRGKRRKGSVFLGPYPSASSVRSATLHSGSSAGCSAW